MTEDRAEAFRTEIAALSIKDPATARDRTLLRLGVAAMLIGVLLTVASYFGSNGTTNALSQRDFIVLSIVGLSITVVGGAVFLRYSLAGFLRFWLARLIYEQHTQTDRLVDED
jgi:hypothetical protein